MTGWNSGGRRQFLFRDFPFSMGVANLIATPPMLDSILASDHGFFTFNVFDAFLQPHLQGLFALWLLIYAVHRLSRRHGRWRDRLVLFVSGLLLLFCVRGFLAAAGIAPLDVARRLHALIALAGIDGIDPVVLKRAGSFVLFVLSAFLLFKARRKFPALFRACAAFGWALALLALVRLAPMIAADVEAAQERRLVVRSAPVDRSVVWVIFDEFDYDRFFVNRNPALALPQLDRLRRASVSARHAVSPASSTDVSVPALLSGTYLSRTEPLGPGRLLLRTRNNDQIEWTSVPTVFSKLMHEGKNVSILGFYLPYCRVFAYADPCHSTPGLAYPGWWWGPLVALRTVPGFEILMEGKRDFYEAGWDKTTRLQLAQLDEHISNRSTTLSFIHLNVPHLPGGRVHAESSPSLVVGLTGYEQNALTVDWIVGRIAATLEHRSGDQDVLLIVSSDHWLRADRVFSRDALARDLGGDRRVVQKIPLFIRRMRESAPYAVDQPVNTVHTASFVDDFLSGRVSTHADIAAWWRRTHYEPPSLAVPDRGVERP